MNATLIGIIAAAAIALLLSAVRIVPEYERGVVFRLGRIIGAKGPGLTLIIPDLRILATVAEVSAERNSTLIVPLPIEILRLVDVLRPADNAPSKAPACAMTSLTVPVLRGGSSSSERLR